MQRTKVNGLVAWSVLSVMLAGLVAFATLAPRLLIAQLGQWGLAVEHSVARGDDFDQQRAPGDDFDRGALA